MIAISIDQGTTATKSHSLNEDGKFKTLSSVPHRQIYPHPQWVEQDPLELKKNVENCIQAAPSQACIGIANQGETIIAWDKLTKQPIYNAIVWQDARTQEFMEKLKADGAEELTLQQAGLPLDPYFSASKFRWILDQVPEARELLQQKRLRMGTSDTFFLDTIAGVFVTDLATASRTSLLNIRDGKWDASLLDLFGVPQECLPDIGPSVGHIAPLKDGKKITTSIVDQQAALFGHGCRQKGEGKITFGTGAFALCLAGPEILTQPLNGLLATIAWKIGTNEPLYALDGGIYNAASAVNWARNLGLFNQYEEIEPFAVQSALERNLIFVPALSGLGSPYWDRSAAGMWLGLSLETDRQTMMMALLEGIALRAGQIIAAMEKIRPINAPLSIDGGLAKNRYFCHFLADTLHRPIALASTPELTGLGTAQMAMLGAGHPVVFLQQSRTVIEPADPVKPYLLKRFEDAVERARNWR